MRKRSRGTSPTSTRSADDPALEQDISETEAAAAAFRERYHGKVAELDAAELAEAIAERERIDEVFTRAAYFAHLNFATNMADPARGALVARLTEKGAAVETELLFFTLELAAHRRRAGRGAARGARARRPPALAAVAAQVPPVPALGARGADRDREGRLRRLCLVAPLRGAARRAAGAARRRGARARDGDGEALRRRPRRAERRRRRDHGGARARAAHTRVRLQRDPARQVHRRPAARLRDLALRRATSPTRPPTRPCRR